MSTTTDRHACEFDWCVSNSGCPVEHYSDASITNKHGFVIRCNAWVDLTHDYDDEIYFYIQPADGDGHGLSLTDDQARELQTLIDKALAQRAEARATVVP